MKNSEIILIFTLLLFTLNFSSAQNLIPNGSFEEFTTDTIPFKPKQFENIRYWEYLTTNRTKGSIFVWVGNRNLINKKVFPDGIVTLYFRNFQQTSEDDLCRTVFTVKLKEALKKDVCYRFSYYIRIHSIGSYPNEIVNHQLVKFFMRKNKLNEMAEIKTLQDEKPVVMLPEGKTYKEYYEAGMVLNSVDFKAKGDEEYLVFGVVDTVYTKIWTTFTIDDVKLIEIGENLTNIKTLIVGSTIVIENVLFEINKAVLCPSSYAALNKLVDELKQEEKLKIEISGHTDNVGSDKRNKELSEQRAKAVVDYLMKKGVLYERLNYKGYGSSRPIANNGTAAGRKLNRRVEITVLEK